jgi:hypothetical protein
MRYCLPTSLAYRRERKASKSIAVETMRLASAAEGWTAIVSLECFWRGLARLNLSDAKDSHNG